MSFCDDGMNELCSVRVHDTRQRWHEVIMRISAHPTVSLTPYRFPKISVIISNFMSANEVSFHFHLRPVYTYRQRDRFCEGHL